MGNKSKTQGIAVRTQAVPASNYIYVPFNTDTADSYPGTAIAKVPYTTNLSGLSTEQDIVGVTTSVWTTDKGFLTGDADGGNDNYIEFEGGGNATMRAFCQLEALEDVGGLLFCLNLKFGNDASVRRVIDWSYADTTDGGYVLWLAADHSPLVKHKNAGNGATTNVLSNAALAHSTDHNMVMFADCVNKEWVGYINGASFGTENAMPSDGTSLPTMKNPWGLTLLGSAGGTPSGNPDDVSIGNLLIVRLESDQSALIATIAEQWNKNSREIPQALNGV